MYAYALNTSSSTQYYVSWNGATEVRSWRIYTSTGSSSSNPKVKKLATVPKEGFETTYTAASHHQWNIVEALDAHGKGIQSSSRVVETFVPSEKRAAKCEEGGCPGAQAYIFGPTVAGIPHPKRSRMHRASSGSSSSAVPGRALPNRGK
jgi:hypothetical protein